MSPLLRVGVGEGAGLSARATEPSNKIAGGIRRLGESTQHNLPSRPGSKLATLRVGQPVATYVPSRGLSHGHVITN